MAADNTRSIVEVVKRGSKEELLSMLSAQTRRSGKRDKVLALLASVKYHQIDCYKALIDHGVPANSCNAEHMNALHFAFHCSSTLDHIDDIISITRSNCTEANFKKFINQISHSNRRKTFSWRRGVSPLHVAVVSCKTEGVKKLLQAGATVDQRSTDDVTPLMKSAELCHQEILEVLLEAGADATLSDSQGFTALRYAIESYGGVKMARTLVSKGADVNKSCLNTNETPLMAALAIGDEKVVDFLIEQGADIEKCCTLRASESTLIRAVAANNIRIVRYILQKHSNIKKMAATDSSLLEACQVGSLPIAKLLIENGWNLKTSDFYTKKSCLVIAAQNHKADLLCYLLAEYKRQSLENIIAADVTSALRVAITTASESSVSALLSHGADPAEPCDNGSGQSSVLMLLLRRFSFPCDADELKLFTPLLKCFLRHGCRLNLREACLINKQYTAFELCLVGRIVEIAELLWLAGSPICPQEWESEQLPPITDLVMNLADFPHYTVYYTKRSTQTKHFINTLFNEPRSLASVCRLVIRNSMQPSIAENSKELPLPENLKQYINLSEIDDLLAQFVENAFDPYKLPLLPEDEEELTEMSTSPTESSSQSDWEDL